MYESYFGLTQEPFAVAPDPRFLFLSEQHRKALAHLDYGLRRGGGFVLLTGEIGAGKTTVWRHFLEQLPDNVDVASVVNPKLGVKALLARICEDLRIEPASLHDGHVDAIDMLHGHLLLAHARGRRTLIVVDEAQALSVEVLEQLRLLTNLVTGERKLVQVLLIGQPELRTMLESAVLEPLAQRVVARFHLPALTADETRSYIAHRLAVAGLPDARLFDDTALQRIHAICGGVPRRINVLCDRSLLVARLVTRKRVDDAVVERAAVDVFGRSAPQPPPAPPVAPAPPAQAPPAPVQTPAPLANAPLEAAASRGGPSAYTLAGVAGGALALGVVLAMLALQKPAALPWSGPPAPLAAADKGPSVPALPDQAPAAPSAAQQTALAAKPPEPAQKPGLDLIFVTAAPDEGMVWRALAGLWGSTLPPGDPCTAAPAVALHCYRGRGGLAPIRLLDRPVVIPLLDERGRSVHVQLVGLSDEQATLRAGRVEVSVPLAQLARYWRGDFGTLWHVPPGYGAGDVVGPNSPTAPWLLQRLALVEGAAATAGASLSSRVFAFQLAQGLQPDGLAGPLTLMLVNRASGVEEPRLAPPR